MVEIEIEVPQATYEQVEIIANKWKCTPDEAASIMLAAFLQENEWVKVKTNEPTA